MVDAPRGRPPLRDPNTTEMSPRERAAKRVAELRGHAGGDEVDGHDKFYFDPNMYPDGWTYEWKRRLLLNQENPAYETELSRQGWDPVPVTRHPEMMPRNYKGTTIERDGMMLMERPTELVEEARNRELRTARKQVRAKEEQLGSTPDGTMTRNHPNVKPVLRKSFEPMSVPEE